MKPKKKAKPEIRRGRPPKPAGTAATVSITLGCSGDDLAALDRLARVQKISRSALIMAAVREKYPGEFAAAEK